MWMADRIDTMNYMDDCDKIFEDELPEMFEEFEGTEDEWQEYVRHMLEDGDPDEDFELPFK